MSKKCKYEYFDKFGNRSEIYYNNVAKHGEKIAQAMFITNALKQDTIIKGSKVIDNNKKLYTKFDYQEMRDKGYIGATSVVNNSKDDELSKRIKRNLAYTIKIREELIRKGLEEDRKIVNPEEYVHVSRHDKYAETAKEVKEKHFNYDPKTLKANNNIDEFKALLVDAENLVDLQINKGQLQHMFLEQVFVAKTEANRKGSTHFDDYIRKAETAYNKIAKANKGNQFGNQTLDKRSIQSLIAIAETLVSQADELNDTYEVNDFEFLPEVSINTTKIKSGDKPIQGHIDLMIYSPSRKLAYIIDYKTKSEQSLANYENAFGMMQFPFETLPQSPKNTTAIQTNIYEIILNQEYGIQVIGNDVLLITSKISDGDIKKPKTTGKREWKISKIDHTKTKQQKLPNIKGLLDYVLDIEKPVSIGEKSTDELIDEIYDGKLVTAVGSKDNYIKGQEKNIKKTDDERFKWFNTNDRSNPIIRDTKDELLKGIGEAYDELQINKKRAAPDLVHMFNEEGDIPEGSIWRKRDYYNKAAELLQEYSPEVHELESFHQVNGIGKDIIIARNKLTNEITLISIATVFNTEYNFNETEDESAKTTVFGSGIADINVEKKYGKNKIPKADTHSLTHMRLAILAAELKTMNPGKYGKVGRLLSTTLAADEPFSYSYINPQMGLLKQMVEIRKENGQPIPTELIVIAENSELSGKDAYKVDYFGIFAKRIQQGMDPLKLLLKHKNNLNSYNVSKVRELLQESFAQFNEDRFNHETAKIIETELEKYVQTVFSALLSKDKHIDDVYRNDLFVAANRAWLSFKDWMVTENTTYKGHMLGQLNSLMTSGDAQAQNLHVAISQYEQRARDEIVELFAEHTILQKELMRSSNEVGLIGELFDSNNFKKIFGPMMVDGYKFSKDKVIDWMKFKDPDDPKSNLSPAEKKYIKFYSKIVEQSSHTLFRSNYKLMYSEEESDVYDIKKWDKHGIPIISSTDNLDLQEVALSSKGLEASVEILKKILRRGGKSGTEKSKDITTPWKFTTMFPEQVDSAPGRGSKGSRQLLNITDDNSVVENKRNIELNPASVLNLMIVEAARKDHMKVAAFAAFSMNAELAYKKLYAGVDTDALRNLMTPIATMRIHGKVKDEGTFAKVVDTTKSLTALALFFNSVSQSTTEPATVIFQLTSQSIANIFNKTLFKGSNKYNNADMRWAGKKAATAFGNQIITDTGMYNTNLGQFTDDVHVETKRKLAWQTKHGFWFIKNTLSQGVQAIVLAQMHKEGVTEKCYTINEKTKRFEYDETLDDRFYVYNAKNPVDGQKYTKEPETDEDKAKWELWKAHRKILAKEGGIDNKGRMKRPFIMQQLQSLKNYAVRLIGSMDNAEVMALEEGAIGRALITFQRYLRQKVENYVGNSNDKTLREGYWGFNADNKNVWIEQEFNGMIKSFTNMIKDIGRFGGWKGMIANTSDVDKRNVAKLLADLLMGAILITLVMELKDSTFAKSVFGKDVVKGIRNATSDIIPAVAVKDALTGSPMAAVSIAINTTSNVLTTLGYVVTGNLENAISATDKTLSVIGSYRTAKGFGDLLFDFEKQ